MPFTIHRHDTIDSTSSEAARRVRSGEAVHGEVHAAREQTAGRGRQGRAWHGAPGEGLMASVVWLCDAAPGGAAVTMAAGLAVLEGCRDLGLDGARLDWPNDLVVRDAKLAGILVEALRAPDGRTALVVGVGVNAAQRAFAPELATERAVTSLALEGVDATPDDLLDALLPRLERRLTQAVDPRLHERLARDFAAATGLVGAAVRARVAERDGEHEHRGALVGLDLDGGVELALADGHRRRFALEHVRALDPA